MGFLPADDPEVVVYIAVDNAKGITQYGGTIAAPLAKKVMLSAIDILQIEKREGEIPKEFVYLDPVYVSVPDVVGDDLKTAQKKLKDFNIKVEGSGHILYQSPPSGTKIVKGDTIRLYLH